MFNLAGKGVHHWYNLFVILSLSGSTPILKYAGFPLESQSEELIDAARGFLRQFHGFVPYIYSDKESVEAIQGLFNRTYAQLLEKTGEAAAHQLCEWGNLLNDDEKLADSVHYTVMSIGSSYYSVPATLPVQPPALPAEKQTSLMLAFQCYMEKRNSIKLAVERLGEKVNETGWGIELIRLYDRYMIYDNHPPLEKMMDFYSYFRSQIDFCLKRCLLVGIEQQFTQEELITLDTWLKTYACLINIWTPQESYSLSETLSFLRSYDNSFFNDICQHVQYFDLENSISTARHQ